LVIGEHGTSCAFGATFSLPAVRGRHGVLRSLLPPMTWEEEAALKRSAEQIRQALDKAGRD
jgi:malate/lactate dehydrogenase